MKIRYYKWLGKIYFPYHVVIFDKETPIKWYSGDINILFSDYEYKYFTIEKDPDIIKELLLKHLNDKLIEITNMRLLLTKFNNIV